MQADGQDKGQSVKEIVAEEKERLDLFIEHAKEYTETRLDLISITIQEKFSGIASSIVFGIVIGVLGIIIFFFLSAGLAWWIGEKFHSASIGFFSMAGIYIVIGALIFMLREKLIINPTINFLMRKINIHEDE